MISKTRGSLILILFLIISLTVSFKNVLDDDPKKHKLLSIEEAIKKRIVNVTFKGQDGHRGDCIRIVIKNILKKDTSVCLEAGRRLLSKDTSKQDILIVREQNIQLASGETKEISAFGFCCQSNKSSPSQNEIFKVGHMADSPLIKLAQYLNENDFSLSAMQSAVWAISNDHSISSISDRNIHNVKELQKLVASIKGIKMDFPWHSITYKEDTSQLFSGIHDSLYGEFEFYLSNNTVISMIVHNQKGMVMDRIFVRKPVHRGNYVYPIKLDVSLYPKGRYYLRLFDESQKKFEKVFQL